MSNPADERESLQALLTHPGWLIVVAWGRETFGATAYIARVKQMLGENRPDLGAGLKLLDAEAETANMLLTYPERRLAALESIGAGLASVLAAENQNIWPGRRGTL